MRFTHALLALCVTGSLSVSTTYAQSFYKEKLSLFNWGYGRSNMQFTFPEPPVYDISVRHFPLTYEFYSRNAYFHSDILTPLIDLCQGAFNSEFWWGHPDAGFVFNGGDYPLARLGLGGYIGNRVGLYAGGQWGWSHWKVEPGGPQTGRQFLYDEVQKTEVGGHTFGPGIHAVVDFPRLLIRSSVMYDFVTFGFSEGRYTKGTTVDIMATYGILPGNRLGVFANYIVSPSRSDVHISKFRIGITLAFNR
jgi:hypothetical protein